MGCVIKKKSFVVSNVIEVEKENLATENLPTIHNTEKEINLSNFTKRKTKTKILSNKLTDIAKQMKTDGEDLSKIIISKYKIKKREKVDVHEIVEESSEFYSQNSMNSLRTKELLEKEEDSERTIQKYKSMKSIKNDMKTTLKGIFFNVLKNNSQITFKETFKNTVNGSIKNNIPLPLPQDKGNISFNEFNSNNSNESIFSVYPISSENKNCHNLLDLEDEEEEETDEGCQSTINLSTDQMTPLLTLDNSNSPYQTLNTKRNSTNLFTHYKEKCSTFLDVNRINNKNLDESCLNIKIPTSPKSPGKLFNYLQIKYDVFDKKNPHINYKKVFLLNLKKTLFQVNKFLNMQKSLNRENKLKNGYINIHNFINNFEVLNNHSTELENIIPTEQKDFLYPLYQIVSNNLEIKVSYLEKISDDNLIINNKYEILYEISNDELYQIWRVYKCRNLNKNSFCSLKIIDKTRQNELNFRSFTNHDINIENRMVYNKYSIKIKEFMTSKNFDYLVMEDVDCSLYDLVTYSLKENFTINSSIEDYENSENEVNSINYEIGIEEIWKLLRNLISAIDYCHNVAKIAHRNLNLKNVFFVKHNFSLKISDYSFSSFIEDQNEYLPYEKSLTCSYPPPEYNEDVYSGEGGDVWAAGILLFFMINKYIPCELCNVPSKLE